MKHVKAGGILLFDSAGMEKFLLMVHPHRYDLPKGHKKNSESIRECAIREFTEETGIPENQIEIDKNFKFVYTYYPKYKKFDYEKVEKELTVYIAHLKKPYPIVPTEHENYVWIDWAPPHSIQEFTIDPLLAQVNEYFSGKKEETCSQ
jgi:8-oxo-dGTP pyrophosphatase MutT (NUDIX family)